MWLFIIRHRYVIIAGLLCLIAAANLYRTLSYRDYSYTSSEGKVIITLKNGRYIELNSRIDFVSRNTTPQSRPFTNATFLDERTKDFDAFLLNRTDIQNIESGDNKKVITAHRTTPADLNVSYDISTIISTSGSNYFTQIDYSGETEFIQTDKTISFSDNSCTVILTKIGAYNYVTSNKKTITISRAYQNDLHFDINLSIKCN